MVLNEPRRSESVRALSKGGRLLPPLLARLIPNRAILVASDLPRSARNAGTCSVGATLGLYSKLMSERARLRGMSLHSLRPRIRLHMADMDDSISPRGTGAGGLKGIYGADGHEAKQHQRYRPANHHPRSLEPQRLSSTVANPPQSRG